MPIFINYPDYINNKILENGVPTKARVNPNFIETLFEIYFGYGSDRSLPSRKGDGSKKTIPYSKEVSNKRDKLTETQEGLKIF